MLWTGTASSAVDLNPNTYLASEALSTNGLYQVGYADQGPGAAYHAMIWAGTAGSALDLSSLIPGGASNSQALAIDANGDVFGYAVENGKTFAVEWAIPEPASLAILGLGASMLLARRRRFA